MIPIFPLSQPTKRRPSMKPTTDEYHVIDHIIAIILSLSISLINNLWPSTSTPTHATKPLEAQKKEAGGTNAVSRSRASSGRTKTSKSSKTKTTSSSKSARQSSTKRPSTTQKAAAPSRSRTAPGDTPSCQVVVTQLDTTKTTTSSHCSKTDSLNLTLQSVPITADA